MQYYVNKEDLAYIVFDGISSTDFKIVITKFDNLSSSERNIESTTIPGKDGEHIEEKEVSNKQIDVEFYIDADDVEDINVLSKRIKKWLQCKKGYKELIYSDDLNTVYEAVCINKIEIDEVIEALGECKVTFSVKPYNHIESGSITITETSTIHNQYSESSPYMKIYGSGDMTISINNKNLILKGVDEFIEVDSEEMECYKTVNGMITYHNDKMYSEFPVLEEGNNDISWIGNISKIEITPNWIER